MRSAAGILVLTLGLAVPAGASRAKPVVPPFIQHLIKSKAGNLAYVPARVPFRYRYRSFKYDKERRILTVGFADSRFAQNGKHSLAFTARPFAGTLASCAAGKQKTLQMGGNRVYWDGSVAWRCVRRPDGKRVKLSATGPNLPDVALGRVVASGKRIT